MKLLLRFAAVVASIGVAIVAGCICLVIVGIFASRLRIENQGAIAVQYAASAIAGMILGARVAKNMWPTRETSSDELAAAMRRRFPRWTLATIGLHIAAMAIFALPIAPAMFSGGPLPGLNYPDLGPIISVLVWLAIFGFNAMSTLVCGTMAISGPENPLEKQTESKIVAWSCIVLALNIGYVALGAWPKG